MPETEGGVAASEAQTESTAGRLPQSIVRAKAVSVDVRADLTRIARTAYGRAEITIGEHEIDEGDDLDSLILRAKAAEGQDGFGKKDAIGVNRALKDIVNSELDRQVEVRDEAQRRFDEINAEVRSGEERLDQVSQERRLGKGTRVKRAHRHLQERNSIKGQLQTELEEQRDKVNNARTKTSEQSYTLQSQVDNDFIAIARERVETVKGAYEGVLEEIFSDGTLTREIGERYIAEVIEPKIDQLLQSEKIDESKKAALNEAFNKIFDEKVNDFKERKNILEPFLSDFSFYNLHDDLRVFQSGIDFFAVNQLVSAVYTLELKSVTTDLENVAPRGVIESIPYLNYAPDNPEFGNEPIKDVYKTLYQSSIIFEGPSGFRSNQMELWTLLKSTPGIRDVLGAQIDEIDHHNYEVLINNSLRDKGGAYIDALFHYPRPEAIRNLVLIAAADYENYRTTHANAILTLLAERPDWHDLLDAAEAQYPEISTVRSLLEPFEDPGVEMPHPLLGEAASTFALGVFNAEMAKGQGANIHLSELAKELLPNSALTDLVADAGSISDVEAQTIKDVLVFLKNLSQEEGDEQTVSDKQFNTHLRENLKNLVFHKTESTPDQIIRTIKGFAILSRKILDDDLGHEAIRYLTSDLLEMAVKEPDLFLTSDYAVECLTVLAEGGIKSLTTEQNSRLGQEALRVQLRGIVLNLSAVEINRLNSSSSNTDLGINADNWQAYLIAYARMNNDDLVLPIVSESNVEKLNSLFTDPNTKDFCLAQYRNAWNDYLGNQDPADFPFSLSFMSGFVDFGGVGHLSHLEALGSFINAYREIFAKRDISSSTHAEIFQGISDIENRFRNERWSNDAQSEFYNISKDILKADPNLYADFLVLFKTLNASEMQLFARELFPLYRGKLALIGKMSFDSSVSYEQEDLDAVREDVKSFTERVHREEAPFDRQKNKLVTEITEIFKDKFGISKVPEEFTPNHLRCLTDVSIYLANLHDRSPDRETVLGFYLALMLDDKWDDFRTGAEINPSDYLVPGKTWVIEQLLRRRKELNPLTSQNLGIEEEKLPEFMRILGQEAQSILIGDVVTIDVKLNNVILNLKGLEDEDLFPNPLDRARIKLLKESGSRAVGSAAAKMFQRLSSPDREISLSDTDIEVQSVIEGILVAQGSDVTANAVKTHFQDEIKPFATVANILTALKESKAEDEVAKLQKMLRPPVGVINVFTRLGEAFTPTSGAFALSQDLSYLSDLASRREKDLVEGEKELVAEYIGAIRGQIIQLQKIYNTIRDKFISLKPSGTVDNELLRTKLDQIDQIIKSEPTQQTITSTATGSLTDMIENMRECLACKAEGTNNDTNLTFGDSNKFYLYSQTGESNRGSISDQIVFLEPVTYSEEEGMEMAFVFDKLYGMSIPSVLESQIMAVMKKYKSLKDNFPEVKLSLFISGSAISTGGMSSEMLEEWLRENSGAEVVEQREAEVDVVESAAGDHYVEFGGEARSAGKRNVSGIMVKI